MECKKWEGVAFLADTVLSSGTKVAVLGAGTMGRILAEGLIRNNVVRSGDVYVTGRGKKENLEHLSSMGAKVCLTNCEAVKGADIVLVCVKKGDMQALLSEIGGFLAGRTVIHIAAGVSTSYVEGLAEHAHVVSAMTSTAAKINEAHTGLCAGSSASERDRKLAEGIFAAMGTAEFIRESQRTAFTTAYACLIALFAYMGECSASAVAGLGSSGSNARRWVVRALEGAAALLKAGEDGSQTRAEVACGGGMTAAGMKKADELGLWGTLQEVVKAMFLRGKELER